MPPESEHRHFLLKTEEEEKSFIDENLIYFEEFFSVLHMRRHFLRNDTKMKLLSFQRLWSSFFDELRSEMYERTDIVRKEVTQTHKCDLNNADSFQALICHYCKRPGHLIDKCRSLRNLCYACGSDKHFLSLCPFKYRSESSDGEYEMFQSTPDWPVPLRSSDFKQPIAENDSKNEQTWKTMQLIPLANRYSILNECLLGSQLDENASISKTKMSSVLKKPRSKFRRSFTKKTATNTASLLIKGKSCLQEYSTVAVSLNVKDVTAKTEEHCNTDRNEDFTDNEQRITTVSPKSESGCITADLVKPFESLKKRLPAYQKFVADTCTRDQSAEKAFNWSFDGEDILEEYPDSDNSLGTILFPNLKDSPLNRTESSSQTDDDSNEQRDEFFTWLQNSLQKQVDDLGRVRTISRWLKDSWLPDINEVWSLEKSESSDSIERDDILHDIYEHLDDMLQCVEDLQVNKNSNKWREMFH